MGKMHELDVLEARFNELNALTNFAWEGKTHEQFADLTLAYLKRRGDELKSSLQELRDRPEEVKSISRSEKFIRTCATPPEVPLALPFTNEAGAILNIYEAEGGPIGGVAILHSKQGAIRSNHWHRTDWHRLYVLSGALLYFERPVGETEMPDPHRYDFGTCFFTGPNVEHAIVFLQETVLISVSKNARDHESHEADLVRVPFVTREFADLMIQADAEIGDAIEAGET